ncbi:cytochrome P450 [Desarmillaria tabescens]|uniref:Cytochrome P450 n=1 Tax=Armillaria tabescens TaxID=1929756 RepID=A0AA39KAT4_ARMTA|nr:cytochrome P450 [Desarmillaria tabescens]KAK0457433.1 cytochrome P450 [Desarmillaria tabescens]
MSIISIPVNRILFATYTPVAAMVLMLWDHCLTFGEEVATMWGPPNERTLTKVIYILNRYFTEAVLIYRLYVTTKLAQSADSEAVVWLTNISAVIIASISQSESPNLCAIERIPTTVACSLGVLLLFYVLVIFMTIYNALERPRRSENELLNSLKCDGGCIYVYAVTILLFGINLTVIYSAMAVTSGVFCYNRGHKLTFQLSIQRMTRNKGDREDLEATGSDETATVHRIKIMRDRGGGPTPVGLAIVKFSVGTQNIVVISERTLLKAMFANRSKSLGAKKVHARIFLALGIHCALDELDAPLHGHFLPSLDYLFSKRVIAKDMKHPFHRRLHVRFQNLENMTRSFTLSELIAYTIYEPLTIAFFGPSFPLNTYTDYHTLDAALLTLMGPLSFTARSGIRARDRLLDIFMSYIQDRDKGDDKDFEGEALSHTLNSVRSGSLSIRDQAACLLGLHWSLHTNLHRSMFWTVAFILQDRTALECLRAEIHETITKRYGGSLDALMEETSLLPEFPLTDSAIKESLRMAGLSSSLREVEFDTNITSGNSSFVIRRGDYVFGDTRAIHVDDSVYPDAATYKVDRFLAGGRAPNTLTWGSGEHIVRLLSATEILSETLQCKGRFLAQYTMKLWLIMLLEMYDISTESSVPEMDPKSWSAIADPLGDMIVCPRRRDNKFWNNA